MTRSEGLTPSERYLARLAKKSFLSLWSYPNVYRAQNKELADLLVVCGSDVILFQDKWSSFPASDSLEADWGRWFRRTVAGGARQVWGAERVVRHLDAQLFEDVRAEVPLPVELPAADKARYHLVVVTHGGSARCQEILGGSGSLMLDTTLRGLESHSRPFVIGDLDPRRTFVHVLDDTTLDILLKTLDTITDFVRFLHKKVLLLRSPTAIAAAGEEELLANYLRNTNAKGEHDFDFGPDAAKMNFIAVTEGLWESFCDHPSRIAQSEQDRISYMWDKLIETFNHYAIRGEQYRLSGFPYARDLAEHEKIVRFMAREPRFHRRILSQRLKEMLETTKNNQRRIGVLLSERPKDASYVFLLFPVPVDPTVTHDQYRAIRASFLRGICMVAKLLNPNMTHVVGIATESGTESRSRSEDALYFDARVWSDEAEKEAREFQQEHEVLLNVAPTRISAHEYPEVASREEFLKNPRNKPCPCGSGRKYKKCCLPKGRQFYRQD